MSQTYNRRSVLSYAVGGAAGAVLLSASRAHTGGRGTQKCPLCAETGHLCVCSRVSVERVGELAPARDHLGVRWVEQVEQLDQPGPDLRSVVPCGPLDERDQAVEDRTYAEHSPRPAASRSRVSSAARAAGA